MVLGTWYLVLGTWYQVLGTWYQVLGTRYQVLGTKGTIGPYGAQWALWGPWGPKCHEMGRRGSPRAETLHARSHASGDHFLRALMGPRAHGAQMGQPLDIFIYFIAASR